MQEILDKFLIEYCIMTENLALYADYHFSGERVIRSLNKILGSRNAFFSVTKNLKVHFRIPQNELYQT